MRAETKQRRGGLLVSIFIALLGFIGVLRAEEWKPDPKLVKERSGMDHLSEGLHLRSFQVQDHTERMSAYRRGSYENHKTGNSESRHARTRGSVRGGDQGGCGVYQDVLREMEGGTIKVSMPKWVGCPDSVAKGKKIYIP